MVFAGTVIGRVISHNRLIEVTLNEEEFNGIKEGQSCGYTIHIWQRIFDANVSRLSVTIEPNTEEENYTLVLLLALNFLLEELVELKLLKAFKKTL